jgi:hypothetical protein
MSRRDNRPIKVYVTEEERRLIEGQASRAGLSASTFLRNVGCGYPVESVVDHRAVVDLLKVSADLGRLGGLLKLWLTNDEKTRGLTPSIQALLKELNDTQTELKEKVARLPS